MANELESYFQALARKDYAFFLEYAHEGRYIPAQHHLYICEHIEKVMRGEIKRLMVFLAARHGKSMTITESLPAYYVMKNPKKKVICVSYADALAQDFGKKNREKVQRNGNLFGVELAQDDNSKKQFSLSGHSGGAVFTGIGGAVTGKGADLLIIDDVIKNRQEAYSKVYRDRVYNEYRNSLYTRLTSKGAIIIINTRWHVDDLCGRILKHEGDKWTVISLPTIAEENDVLGRAKGETLWSEGGFNQEWAERTKETLGPEVWNAMYQQTPTVAEGNIFKKEYFRYYRPAELPNDFETVVISVDTSFTNSSTSDFCALQIWGKVNTSYYLIDAIKERLSFTQTVELLRELDNKYPYSAKLIEHTANGAAIVDTLRQEVEDVIPITPRGDKMSRAFSVQPLFNAKNVYFPHDASFLEDLENELLAFPNVKNDDQVDSMTQALSYLRKFDTQFLL